MAQFSANNLPTNLLGQPIPMQTGARSYVGGRSLLDNIYGQSSNPSIQANPLSRSRRSMMGNMGLMNGVIQPRNFSAKKPNPFLVNKNGYSSLGQQQNAQGLMPKPLPNNRNVAPQNNTPSGFNKNNLLNYISSPQGKGMAQGLLEASGYSKTPVSFGQALALGMQRGNEAEAIATKNKFDREKFDFDKSQATIGNLLTSQGLDIEMQKVLKPKLSNSALRLLDFGIDPNSPEGRALLLQELEGAKTEINLGEKTDVIFKTKFYENTLLKNTNDLNEKAIDNEDMRKTYQQMSLLMKDGVSTGIIDSAFLNVKRLARDLGILSDEQAETISEQELFQKLSNFTVPRMRVAGSGATSNFEAELFKDATATLGDDESTNKIIIQSRLSALNLQREYADFYNQYMSDFDSKSEQKDFTNKIIGNAFREYLNENLSILSNLVGVEKNKIISSEENLSERIKNGTLKAGDMIFSNDAEDNSYNSFTILNDDIINQYLK